MILTFLIPAASAHCMVVINELLPDPLGGDSANEWVELLNTGDDPCDLTGYTLQGGAAGYATMVTLGDVTVEALDFLWIGAAPANVIANLTMGNAATNADGIRLVNADGAVVDAVVYGTPNDDGWTDESGIPANSFAPSPYGGASLGRCPDGADTNQSGADFVNFPVPTPGSSNDYGEPCAVADTGADTGTDSGTDTDTGTDTGTGTDTAIIDTADPGARTLRDPGCGCEGAPGVRVMPFLFALVGCLRRGRVQGSG